MNFVDPFLVDPNSIKVLALARSTTYDRTELPPIYILGGTVRVRARLADVPSYRSMQIWQSLLGKPPV